MKINMSSISSVNVELGYIIQIVAVYTPCYIHTAYHWWIKRWVIADLGKRRVMCVASEPAWSSTQGLDWDQLMLISEPRMWKKNELCIDSKPEPDA